MLQPAVSASEKRGYLESTVISKPLVPMSDLISVGGSTRIVVAVCLFICFVLYAYWPTLVWVEQMWRTEPDYSHGYLVLPLAGLLCWNRGHLFPGVQESPSWVGFWLVGVAVLMRWLGRVGYADFFDAWSILPLVAGAVWVLFGYQSLKWALPAIAFLILMFPLPFQAESLLSWKLQGVATELSTIMLRVLGQSAVNEGHVIWVGDQRLLVEEACSGLRIFIGVAALAFFWAAISNRSWLDRIVLILAAVPLAVLVNAFRITVVGLLNQWFIDPASQQRIHDVSGYFMIPLAFVALYLVKIFWEALYRPVEQLNAKDFLSNSSVSGLAN